MNKKRVAAIAGLIGMGICILCIFCSGFVPAFRDLLWAVDMVAFLVALSISLIFTIRKGEEERSVPEETQDGPASPDEK